MDTWLLYFPISVADIILAGFLFILILISWYYHIGVFGKIKASVGDVSFDKPVSIIIAARNELSNLQRNLPYWLNQDYPSFEVIIADDGSTDGTSDWIVEQKELYPNLNLVMLDAQYVKMHGKKIAITLAIKKAKYQYFLLTDADCVPATEHWIRKMAGGFIAGKDVVIGFSPYSKKPGILNALIRFETLLTALNCFGYAKKGKPYMGVGRNLAYTRSVYEHVHGFSSHSHLPAGDDDLFVQEAASPSNTSLVIDADAYIISNPKTTFNGWWNQKVRHLWVGKYYSTDAKRMLSVLPTTQLFFGLGVLAWIIVGSKFWYPFCFVGIKWIPEWWVKSKKARIFDTKDIIPWIPLLSVVHQFFYILTGIAAFFAKKPKW